MQKIMHFVLHFYMQKQYTLRYVYTYKNPDTLRHIFICKKITLGYVFISKMYRIVLITRYKRTYDQSGQVDK